MTYSHLKLVIYNRIKEYWGGATVKWGSENDVKPLDPLVVLRLGAVIRPTFPISYVVNSYKINAYPSHTTLEVNLFTKGKEHESGYYENTAVNDLINFSNFLDGNGTVDWSSQHNISVTALSGVQDLSEVVNDTSFQFRAFSEWSVDFTEYSAENEGILDEKCLVFDDIGNIVDVDPTKWEQTASGGGTEELAANSTGYFTQSEPKEL